MPRFGCLSAAVLLLLATSCPAALGSVEVPRRTSAAAATTRKHAANRTASGRTLNGKVGQAATGDPSHNCAAGGVDGHDASDDARAGRRGGVPGGYDEGDSDGGGVGVARRSAVQVRLSPQLVRLSPSLGRGQERATAVVWCGWHRSSLMS